MSAKADLLSAGHRRAPMGAVLCPCGWDSTDKYAQNSQRRSFHAHINRVEIVRRSPLAGQLSVCHGPLRVIPRETYVPCFRQTRGKLRRLKKAGKRLARVHGNIGTSHRLMREAGSALDLWSLPFFTLQPLWLLVSPERKSARIPCPRAMTRLVDGKCAQAGNS
jgi:hypothetical protein